MSFEQVVLPGIQEIIDLYNNEIIGFSEARDLLEKTYPIFGEVRDKDLDANGTGK